MPGTLLPCPVCKDDCRVVTQATPTGLAVHVCLHCGEVLAYVAMGGHPVLARPSPSQLRKLREDTTQWREAARVSHEVRHFKLWTPGAEDWPQ